MKHVKWQRRRADLWKEKQAKYGSHLQIHILKALEVLLVCHMALLCGHFNTLHYVIFNMTLQTEIRLHCYKNCGLDISYFENVTSL